MGEIYGIVYLSNDPLVTFLAAYSINVVGYT